MKLTFHRTHWYKGGMFHWNDFRFNGGKAYTSYRFGPLLIRKHT